MFRCPWCGSKSILLQGKLLVLCGRTVECPQCGKEATPSSWTVWSSLLFIGVLATCELLCPETSDLPKALFLGVLVLIVVFVLPLAKKTESRHKFRTKLQLALLIAIIVASMVVAIR